jgi:2-methylcitrate dehydratase
VLFQGRPFRFPQGYDSYVMENVLFKIAFPAEFHAQTAVECALQLHPVVRDRLAEIDRVVIETQEPALRIIDKTGPLANPADRDHCLQYMTAIPLIFGRLTAADYEDDVALDPRVDALRERMLVRENVTFTGEYYDPCKRHIGNAVQVFFKDGSATARTCFDVPLGHRKRRAEGIPLLVKKFERSVAGHFTPVQSDRIRALFADRAKLEAMPVHEFVAAMAKP